MNTQELNEIVSKLEHWCSYQDRSIYEAIQKLDGFGVFGEQREKVIKQLKADSFLDEHRFVESYVQGKFNIKSWGKIKIQNYLREKHRISGALIQSVFEEIEEGDYRNKVSELLRQKLRILPNDLTPIKKKEKCIRFLQSKGFELGLIFEEWDRLGSDF